MQKGAPLSHRKAEAPDAIEINQNVAVTYLDPICGCVVPGEEKKE